MARLKKIFENNTCCFCGSFNNVCKSHSFQKNGPLKQIAAPGDHENSFEVLSFNTIYSLNLTKSYIPGIKSVSSAGTFNGYCPKCDNNVFKSIEVDTTKPAEKYTEKDLLLFLLKAADKIYVDKEEVLINFIMNRHAKVGLDFFVSQSRRARLKLIDTYMCNLMKTNVSKYRNENEKRTEIEILLNFYRIYVDLLDLYFFSAAIKHDMKNTESLLNLHSEVSEGKNDILFSSLIHINPSLDRRIFQVVDIQKNNTSPQFFLNEFEETKENFIPVLVSYIQVNSSQKMIIYATPKSKVNTPVHFDESAINEILRQSGGNLFVNPALISSTSLENEVKGLMYQDPLYALNIQFNA